MSAARYSILIAPEKISRVSQPAEAPGGSITVRRGGVAIEQWAAVCLQPLLQTYMAEHRDLCPSLARGRDHDLVMSENRQLVLELAKGDAEIAVHPRRLLWRGAGRERLSCLRCIRL
jgi:hypothetical protein